MGEKRPWKERPGVRQSATEGRTQNTEEPEEAQEKR
jgi:hypothetical protein